MTKQELEAFFDKFLADNNGKYVDVLPAHAHQCFDVPVAFTDILGVPHAPGNPSPFPYPNASQIYTDYGDFQKQYFDRIPNTTDYVPQKADIIVWDKAINGNIGHVAMGTGSGTVNSFQSLDQNWSPGSVTKLIIHDYKYVLGALRFKTTGATPTPQPPMDDTIKRKAANFDRYWTGYYPSADTDKVTDQQAADRVTWNKQENHRAGEYDKVVNAILGPQDSNKVDAQTIIDKYNAQSGVEAFRAKVLDLVKKA